MTDLRMPDIDGIEVCVHLGTTRPKVAVVIFTQYEAKVETHLRHAFRKLRVEDRDSAVALAASGGLL